MDTQAFYRLSCGLYILSTTFGGTDAACVINTLQQVTSTPAKLSAAIHKENFTQKLLEKSGLFNGVVLTEKTDMDVIRTFGFKTSKDFNKYGECPHKRDALGIPYLTEAVAARFSCKVVNRLDVGTHAVYVGEVVEAEYLSQEAVMTYAYYHQIKNGFTPKHASSYQAPKASKGWLCEVCGYVHADEVLADDFICPVCGVTASEFTPIS